MVHPLLVDGSGRGSCLERPTTCCHNRWSILPSNGVPMEPWSQCGLASVVHLVLAGGSGRYDGTSPITWQGRWSALLRHKGLESWCWYGLASTVHPCWWMAQDGAVALRGPLHAATTDGRFLQATESPWSRGVSVAWHPSCTLWWQVAQGSKDSSASSSEGAVMGHPPYAGKEDGQFFWSTKAPGVLEWLILPSNGVPMESWSQCALAYMVHRMLAGGSGRYDGTSPITWQGRWSALLRHKGLESWCWYGLASMVHPCWWMAQDGAVALRGPLHAATTDGRFLQATESPWSRGISVAWHPSCTLWWQVAQGGKDSSASSSEGAVMGHPPYAGKEDGQFFWSTKAPGVLENSCLERPTMCCLDRWLILPRNGVPMEPWSQCALAYMVHRMLAGGSGRYDGTSPITWQGRRSALLRHKGLES
ncbi:uncharacterized protein LOC144576498 isoform X10 [Callithrix jacchus]